MKDMDVLFILYWRMTTNQFFYLSSCMPKHETLENYFTSFLYQILCLFCFYFLILFLLLLHAYVCEISRSFTHPLTRCPKNEKKQKLEQSTQLEMSGCTCYWRSQMLVRYYCCHCTCAASYLQRSFAAWLLWRTIAKQQPSSPPPRTNRPAIYKI